MIKSLHIILWVLVASALPAQITNNPPANTFQDSYSSGSYVRCAYNVNISETHLSNNVDYLAKAGESIRIQASSGTTPYSNIGGFSGGSFHAFVDPNYNLSGCGASGTIVWDNTYTGDGSIAREVRPVNYQLYPRNSSNKGTVLFSGTDNGNNSTITFYTAKTNFNNVTSTYNITTVNIVNKRFSFSVQIDAELSEYAFAYYLNGQPFNAVTLAEHVVCGDAYIISGQSNAATSASSSDEITMDNTYGAGTTYGRYSRTIKSDDKTSWGVSGTGNTNLNTGIWGLALQYKIQETYGIPTCIINGALGSTSIEKHLPPDSYPNDFFHNPVNYPKYDTSFPPDGCFARMNTRVYNAGLENNIKGIFWWQGDGGPNAPYNYIDHFTPLYNLWATWYPGFNRFYEIQIPSLAAPGTDPSFIRIQSEYQRKMGTIFPNTTVMSANGIGYHRTEPGEEIHHQATGYINMANRLFALLEKDVYGKTTNINDLTPPDIFSATISGTSVSLRFNQNLNLNTAIGDNIYDILSVIKFNNELSPFPVTVTKSNPVISGQYLTFDVNSASGISTVSYAGYIPNTTAANMNNVGCYIRNSKNVGALSFHNFPVTPPGPEMRTMMTNEEEVQHIETSEINQISVYPNPVSDYLTITSGNKPVDRLKISDLAGRVIYEYENTSGRRNFDLSDLQTGIYLISIESNGHVYTSRLVKINH